MRKVAANYRFDDGGYSLYGRMVSFYRTDDGKTGVVDYFGFYRRSEAEDFAKALPDLLNGVDSVSTFGGELSRRYS